MNFGGSSTANDQNRLPPGSAGFGTVEAVDIGGVSIQSGLIQSGVSIPSGLLQNQNLVEPTFQNQNLVQFPTGTGPSNDGLNDLPNYNQANAQQSLISNTNNLNNFQQQPSAQLNFANGFNQVSPTPSQQQSFANGFNQVSPTPPPSQQQSFANTFHQVDPPQHLGGANTASVNIQVTDQFLPNNFGTGSVAGTTQTFRETFPVDVALPNHNNFQASSPINQQQQLINSNQPWVGAQNQQQLLFNQQHQQNGFLPQLQQSIQFNTGTVHTTQRPFSLNERPVRFPDGANNRFDHDYNNPYEFDKDVYYDMPYEIYTTSTIATPRSWRSPNDNSEKQNYITPAPTSNIVAELAKYSNKKNIFYRPVSSDPYIQYPSPEELHEPDKELIMYPSGQLYTSPNNAFPITIGPKLNYHISGQQQQQSQHSHLIHGQKPHYVMGRKKLLTPEYEGKTELFDPLLEGDEVIERSESVQSDIISYSPADSSGDSQNDDNNNKDTTGLWPMLIRTAKDDLKLVGDVIKLALSR